MAPRIIFDRYCERCKSETAQVVELESWSTITATCLQMIDVEDGQDQCAEIHIFTLSHLRNGLFGKKEPFTRADLGITVKGSD